MTEQIAPTVVGSGYVRQVLDIAPVTLSRMIADGRVTPLGKLADAPNGAHLFDKAQIDALAAERRADR